METKEFRKIIADLLKTHGFSKENSCWYKDTDECIVLFYLQRSKFGRFYYINLATCIKKNRSRDFTGKCPYIEYCHVRLRTPDTGPNGEPYARILNMEYYMYMPDEDRRKGLKKLIEDYCIPMLEKLGSIDGIKQLYKDNPDIQYMNPYKSLGI